MKSPNITPVFKKNDRTEKFNYRPVSILLNLSKVFQRSIYKQLLAYFDVILPKRQSGFKKGFNAQQFIKTTRKMETKFRPRLNVWCFIN